MATEHQPALLSVPGPMASVDHELRGTGSGGRDWNGARCNHPQTICRNPLWGRLRDALQGKGPQRRPQERLRRRLEEVAKAVGGGYCRLQMPLKPALAARRTAAGGWAPWRGGGAPPPRQMHPLGRLVLEAAGGEELRSKGLPKNPFPFKKSDFSPQELL